MAARGGRPTDYRPEFVEQAAQLAESGATDEEIAEAFKVHVATIYRWKNEHPAFREALKEWKAAADRRVEASLYRRALGYYEGDEYHAPSDTAAIFWLKNRQPDSWRDRRESDVTIKKPLDPNADPIADLAASIAALANQLAPDET